MTAGACPDTVRCRTCILGVDAVQAKISLLIDQQPGSLFRVVSTLRRAGLRFDQHDLDANRVHRGYSLDLTVDAEKLSTTNLESELRSLRGVTDVLNISAAPRLHTHDLRRSAVMDVAERDRRQRAARRVHSLINAYPLILPEVRAYQSLVSGSASANDLVRNFGVRCGRRMAASEHRFDGVETLSDAFDRVLVGLLFPIAPLRIDGYDLRVSESVFTRKDPAVNPPQQIPGSAACTFLEGMIEGLLNHPPGLPTVYVTETRCVLRGNRECRFRVEPGV